METHARGWWRLGALVAAHLAVLGVLDGLGTWPGAGAPPADGLVRHLHVAPPTELAAAASRLLAIGFVSWSLLTLAVAAVVHGLPATPSRLRVWSLGIVPRPLRRQVRRALTGVVASGVLLGQGAAVAAPLPPGLDPSTVRPAATADEPVVDTLLPPGLGTSSPTAPSPHDSWTGSPSVTPPVATSPHLPATVPTTATSTHVVTAGEHLWSIARDHLAAAGLATTTEDVAAHWRLVVSRNVASLPSGDPDLVHPGQVLTLPPPRT